jgi:hypothetical protein
MAVYPIPALDQMQANVDDRLQGQDAVLAAITDRLVDEVGLRLTYQDQLTKGVKSRLNRVVNGQLRRQEKALAPIQDVAAQASSAATSEALARLAQTEQILTPDQFLSAPSGTPSISLAPPPPAPPSYSVTPAPTPSPDLCAAAPFPVATLPYPSPGGEWWLVCSHNGCVGAYGTLAASYDFSCWRVAGPYPDPQTVGLLWQQWAPTYQFGQPPPDVMLPSPVVQPPAPPPGVLPPSFPPIVPPYTPPAPPPSGPPSYLPPPPPGPPGTGPSVTCPAPQVTVNVPPCPPPNGSVVCADPALNDPCIWDDDQLNRPASKIQVDAFLADVAAGKLPGGCTPSHAGLLPFAGDPDFCAKMIPIRDWLHALGSLILESEGEEFDVADDDDSTKAWILRLLNKVIKYTTLGLRWLVRAWWEGKRWLRNCDWCAVFALDLIEWLISYVRNLKFGFTLVVKVEAVFGLDEHRTRRLLEMVRNYLCPDRTWTLSQVVLADNNGACWTPEFRECMYRAQGADLDRWRPFIEASGKHLGADQHIMHARLDGLTLPQQRARMQCYGWRNEVDLIGLFALYDRPPTPGECLAWASNAITLTDFVKDYTLDAEFYPRMWTPFKGELQAQGITEQVARNQWSHAQRLPGEGVLREAYHRLRPGRAPAGQEFGILDLQRHLAAEGVPPYWRSRMALMSFRTLTHGEIAEGMYWGDYTVEEGIQRLIDAGLSPGDAETVGLNQQVVGRHRLAREIAGWQPHIITRMAGLGVIDAGAAMQRWTHLGFDAPAYAQAMEVWQAENLAILPHEYQRRGLLEPAAGVIEGLRAGFLDGAQAAYQLVQMGIPLASAQAVVSAERYTAGVRRGQQAEMFLRRAFIRGKISDSELAQRLGQLGFTAQHIAEVVPLWKLDQTTGPKQLSEGQIVAYYKDGIISRKTAQARLHNMGWAAQDTAWVLADADQKRALAAQKEAKKKAPKMPATKRIGKSDVEKMYKEGVIGADVARAIMAYNGWIPSAIDLFFAQWDAEIAAKPAKKAPPTLTAAGVKERQLSRGDVKKLFNDGLIDEPTLVQYLQMEGLADGDIQLLIADWCGPGAGKAGPAPGCPQPPAGP